MIFTYLHWTLFNWVRCLNLFFFMIGLKLIVLSIQQMSTKFACPESNSAAIPRWLNSSFHKPCHGPFGRASWQFFSCNLTWSTSLFTNQILLWFIITSLSTDNGWYFLLSDIFLADILSRLYCKQKFWASSNLDCKQSLWNFLVIRWQSSTVDPN